MFWFCLDLVVLFLPSFIVFRFSLLTWHIFLCKIRSLNRHWISSLPVFGFPILFHFWQTVWCRPSTLGGWFFSYDLESLYPPVHLLYSHLHHHSASQRHNIKDRRMNKRRMIKTQEGRRKKTSLEKYSPLTLLQGFERVVQRFACERVLETEHKLHILTPLLWPPRCVFLVLLMLGSTPSGLSEGPLGRLWLSLPHLVFSCLEFYWQLLLGLELNWVK